MKQCKKCKQLLPFEEFYKNSNNMSGLSSWCKSCLHKLDIGGQK